MSKQKNVRLKFVEAELICGTKVQQNDVKKKPGILGSLTLRKKTGHKITIRIDVDGIKHIYNLKKFTPEEISFAEKRFWELHYSFLNGWAHLRN